MKAGPSGPRRAGWATSPAATRLSPDHPLYARILDAHARAVASGLSTYLDPVSGYAVMTAAYLADRGYCCSQGCRHCPWEGAAADPSDADPSD